MESVDGKSWVVFWKGKLYPVKDRMLTIKENFITALSFGVFGQTIIQAFEEEKDFSAHLYHNAEEAGVEWPKRKEKNLKKE